MHEAPYHKERDHYSWLHSQHDLFLLNTVFTREMWITNVSNNSASVTEKDREEMRGKWFGMHFLSLISFLETTFMQKLCSLNFRYGWLLADFHKTHLYIWSGIYCHAPGPAGSIYSWHSVLSVKGCWDRQCVGGLRQALRREWVKILTPLQSSSDVLYMCSTHTHTLKAIVCGLSAS